ncbi:molybdopterin synthase sulfur carrier subunit [Mucilaginibacter gracilis]|uniref:Molybdopterin synthase sulfur carrier subunit n=1 Tax=Mucilaginibacter gracilis TaxID=423350 RepID=A0A495J754_9SPHI|nr:MoaD/ThiS family protein [Mucilaginibacter gracilis]RKR84820.1 molybdopterin synthase sulfur carrier subunit [Mucilaginibacter gracilis]
MKIQVFAVLKDYFDKEFELGGDVADVASLQQKLIALNTDAAGILKICRFAVHDEFVDQNYSLKNNDTICIFPPSSGG